MGYSKPKKQGYTGEYFEAIYKGEQYDAGTEYVIYQLEPRLWVAQTGSYSAAVELVNRLDTTGEASWGEDY